MVSNLVGNGPFCPFRDLIIPSIYFSYHDEQVDGMWVVLADLFGNDFCCRLSGSSGNDNDNRAAGGVRWKSAGK